MMLRILLLGAFGLGLFHFSLAAESDSKFTVSREEIDQQFKDFDQEIRAGKAIPTIQDGKVVGYTSRPKRNKKDSKTALDQMQLTPSDQGNSPNIGRE